MSPAEPFPVAARRALADSQLRRNLARATRTIRDKRSAAVAELDDWEELREAGRRPLAEAAVDEKREETAAEVPDRVEALVETAETVAESVGPAEAVPTPGPARAPGRDAARVVPLQTPRRPKGIPRSLASPFLDRGGIRQAGRVSRRLVGDRPGV